MEITGLISTIGTALATMAAGRQAVKGAQNKVNANIASSSGHNNMGIYKGSLTSIVSDYTIEPYLLTTRSAQNSEVIEDTYHLATNIFTAFYAQVFDILTKVHNLDANIIVTLMSSKLRKQDVSTITNTGKEILVGTAVAAGAAILNKMKEKEVSKESSIDYLFSTESLCLNQDAIATEAVNVRNVKSKEQEKVPGASVGEDTILYGTLMRDINVDIIVGGNVMKIPINVMGRLLDISIESILGMCSNKGSSIGFWARVDEARSGGISWWKDFFFCSDLVKEYKATRLAESGGTVDKIISRNKSAIIKKLATGQKGFEGNYNFYIITQDDLVLINKFMRGNIITKDKVKEDFLDRTNAMCTIVLDDDYQKATVLIKDIYGSSILSYKALANQSKTGKSSNDNMSELIRAMMANRQIGF